LANFDENCKIYSKEVLFNEINGINDSDKFGRNYEDLHFGGTFWGNRVYSRCD